MDLKVGVVVLRSRHIFEWLWKKNNMEDSFFHSWLGLRTRLGIYQSFGLTFNEGHYDLLIKIRNENETRMKN